MSTFEFDESGGAAKLDTASLPEAQTLNAPAHEAANATAPRGQIYTVMAREGINAAEVVNTAMRKREVGKETPRRIEVIAPHGPSTSGGKKARQSITLVPASGQGAGLMCGFLDVAQKQVVTRDYSVVAEQYRKRFGKRFDVTAEEYVALMKQLSGMLETLGFKLVAEDISESAPIAPKANDGNEGNDEFQLSGSERAKLLWLAAGAVLLVALIIVALR